jgi:putative ABC transport system permease protein
VLDDRALHRTPSGTVDVPSAGVSPEYFETMGIALLHGRLFTDADRVGAARVAIVSEAMGRRFWGESNVVGRTYRHEGNENSWVTVVGVVRDVPLVSPGESPRPFVYRPHAQGGWGRAALVVRGSGDPNELVNALRHEVHAIDPAIPVIDAAPMSEHVARSLSIPRAAMRLLIALGAMAILLAAVGIYSVVAFSVARRRAEIGVRMALGASARQVIGMVVGEMMRLVLIGIAAGLILAAFLTPIMRALLVGIHPLDPVTFAGVAAIVATIAALTAWWPARRAADANLATVLKTE